MNIHNMNNVVTYRSEGSINSSENLPSRKSKEVKCPRCNNIGYTIVNEECDYCAIIGILVFFPFILCLPCGYGKKEKHYCKYCSYDCTNVEEYKEGICLII